MTSKVDFMLADSFEVTGEWWLPEKPGDKLYGSLRYSTTNIELELCGTLEERDAADLMGGWPKVANHRCIHGLTHERQKFTLLRAHASSLSATTTYSVSHVITDMHALAFDELKLQRVSFYCQHLDMFISRNLFRIEDDGEREDFKSCTVTYHQPEKLVWRVDEIGAAIDFQTEMKRNADFYQQWHELHAQSFVTITPDSPQDLDWHIQKIWRFCYFLTLVTDEVVSPTGIKVFLEDEKYPGWHLYQAVKKREAVETARPFFLFRLEHLTDCFELMLKKWFSVSEIMLDSIHLMMDAQRNQNHNTQGRFLLLAHAVEVLSRATTSSEYMPSSDYGKVIDAINRAIPEVVKSDHRMSLKSKIKYGNEFAFHKRIRVLLETLSEEGREIVCKEPAKFCRGIADTRNYYTHFTDELRPKALPPVPMYWASEKLSFLVRIVLFKYLGIAEAIVVKRMSEHHRLMQWISLSKEHPEVMTDA